MAKVKSVVVKFPASPSPDVLEYRPYMAEAPNAVGYDSPAFDLGNVTELDLSAIEGMTSKDGVYNLGITAVDDAGNVSSMSLAENVAINFAAPDPPGVIVVERS